MYYSAHLHFWERKKDSQTICFGATVYFELCLRIILKLKRTHKLPWLRDMTRQSWPISQQLYTRSSWSELTV